MCVFPGLCNPSFGSENYLVALRTPPQYLELGNLPPSTGVFYVRAGRASFYSCPPRKFYG